MKTFTRVALLAVGLAAAALPVLTAGDADSARVAKHPRLRALLQRRHAARQHIAHRLGLSADQVTQLKGERAKVRTTIESIRADTTLTREQKRAKLRETLQAARTEMRGVLNEQQQQRVQQMRERLRARFGHRQ
jgi:hypothetical protein